MLSSETSEKRHRINYQRVDNAMNRVRRVRQELERNVVWRPSRFSAEAKAGTSVDHTLFPSEYDKSKLEMKLYFNLRMTSFFPSLFISSDAIYREIADILREGVVEELHAKRLCSHIFG